MFHYIQSPGTQPRGGIIPPYRERIELVTGGRGWILDGQAWREVKPGDLIWNAPGNCTIGRSDEKNPYRCLAITFSTRKAGGTGMRRFSFWPELEEIHSLAREASGLFYDEKFPRDVLRNYLFSRLVFQVQLHERAMQNEGYPAPIRTVMLRIERDFSRPLSVDKLSREAGWSPAYLYEMFRNRVGMSPHQWLLRHRLRMVKERLLTTSEPVKKIAVECGFADAATLTHAFRTHAGETPVSFRNRFQQMKPPESVK